MILIDILEPDFFLRVISRQLFAHIVVDNYVPGVWYRYGIKSKMICCEANGIIVVIIIIKILLLLLLLFCIIVIISPLTLVYRRHFYNTSTEGGGGYYPSLDFRRGVGHDVIKILNISAIQCKFNRCLKISTISNDVVK